jgi:hypothetical protein
MIVAARVVVQDSTIKRKNKGGPDAPLAGLRDLTAVPFLYGRFLLATTMHVLDVVRACWLDTCWRAARATRRSGCWVHCMPAASP